MHGCTKFEDIPNHRGWDWRSRVPRFARRVPRREVGILTFLADRDMKVLPRLSSMRRLSGCSGSLTGWVDCRPCCRPGTIEPRSHFRSRRPLPRGRRARRSSSSSSRTIHHINRISTTPLVGMECVRETESRGSARRRTVTRDHLSRKQPPDHINMSTPPSSGGWRCERGPRGTLRRRPRARERPSQKQPPHPFRPPLPQRLVRPADSIPSCHPHPSSHHDPFLHVPHLGPCLRQ